MATHTFHTGFTPRQSHFGLASALSTAAKDERDTVDQETHSHVRGRGRPALDPLGTLLAEIPFSWDSQLASVPTRNDDVATQFAKFSGLSDGVGAATARTRPDMGLAPISSFLDFHIKTPLGLPWTAIEAEWAQSLPSSRPVPSDTGLFAYPPDLAPETYAPFELCSLGTFAGPWSPGGIDAVSGTFSLQHEPNVRSVSCPPRPSTGLTPPPVRFDAFSTLLTPKPLPTPALPGRNKRRVSFAFPNGPPNVTLQPAPKKQKRNIPRSYHLPQKDASKPWVRTNSSTLGKTSRTSKINEYRADLIYAKVAHPLGPWGRWTYNKFNELTDCSISASSLKEFIYSHPVTPSCRLTLFIQRSPADSKRRYETTTQDKCKLRECPVRGLGVKSVREGGTILHGHYRVALDELWAAHGDIVDPFHTAGYVHLFCLETFLDLPEICRLPNVDVIGDNRILLKEPNGIFAAALDAKEAPIVEFFLSQAQFHALPTTNLLCTYAQQGQYRTGPDGGTVASKDHDNTLNFVLQTAKNESRNSRVMSNLRPTNVAVHRGDLDVYARGWQGHLSGGEVASKIKASDC